MKLLKAMWVYIVCMVQPATIYSLPALPPDSVILDDEVSKTFECCFQLLLKGNKKSTLVPRIFLIANQSVNAASGAGGQFVIFSGLFRMCETLEEFLGVLAHEIAHGQGHHMTQAALGQENAIMRAAIAFALGGIAALGARDSAPLVAGMMGAQNIYTTSSMYTMRNLEKAADAEAIKILSRVNVPSVGLLTFLQKLYKEYGRPDMNPYFLDHPLTEDRIDAIKKDALFQTHASWPQKEKLEKMFFRVRTKILAFTLAPQKVLKMFSGDTVNDIYARAVALGRMPGQTTKALDHMETLLAQEPNNPYFLELKSQLLLDDRRIEDAISVIKQAVHVSPSSLYLCLSLAHLLIEENRDLDLAIKHLLKITQKNHDDAFAWHLLGKAYALQGKEERALWANAEHASLIGDKVAAKAKTKSAINRAQKASDKVLSQKLKDLESSLSED